LIGFIQQRTRWGVAYYHSRGRNLRHALELKNPRALVFLWNLFGHGSGIGHSIVWIFLIVSVIMVGSHYPAISPTHYSPFSLHVPSSSFLNVLLVKLGWFHSIIQGAQFILVAYYLNKLKKLSDVIYFPIMRILSIIIAQYVNLQAMNVILFWSSKWRQYNNESFKDLRKEVNRSVDPMYPSGEEQSQ
jgi:hypothetical protein